MRRNRVKAVINVPRGGRSAPTDRPLTPISSNSTHEPSSSPIPQHLQESPLRSPSPLISPTLKSPMDYPYPTLGLVRSPEKPCALKILSVSPLPSVGSPSKADRFERPTTPLSHLDHFPYVTVNSNNFPISPGGIQRPSPSASPSKYIPMGVLPNSPQRPSPSPSPTNSIERNRQIVVFNTNSNSADSHEVARYMAPSPASMFSPKTPEDHHSYNRSKTPVHLSGQGAFSSVMRDPANSIVNNSDSLRQRLQKQPASLSVTKYQTLRKEFMNKGLSYQPSKERKKLTMLHFAFWNPPNNEKPASRSRASSVCSDKGSSQGEEKGNSGKPNVKSDKEVGINSRRVTVGDIAHNSSSIRRDNESTSDDDDASSTISSSTPQSTSLGPRVKVGPDGQLIIDEQSLVVETSESQRAKKQLSEMETVSGADFVVGSSGLFRNKRKSRRGHDWSDRETIKFYKALSMCGTDFSMMTTLFPDRSRAELKAKFKREDRKNPGQISLALACQEFDPDEGITDDEETPQESEDLVIGKSGKPTRKRGKRLVTELDRRLEEELEESRVIFGTESEEAEVQPQFKNLSLQKTEKQSGNQNKAPIKGVGSRAKAPWRSNVIVDDKTGQNISFSELKKRGLLDIGSVKPPPKKRKERRASDMGRKPCTKKKSIPTKTEKPPEIPDTRPLDCIDILRFDGSDPLGLKILAAAVAKKVSEKSDLTTALNRRRPSRDLETLSPVKIKFHSEEIPSSRRTRSKSSLSSNASDDTEELQEVRPPKKKSALPPNVKVLPFRVPGPGPFKAPPSQSLVDEIEIEITC